MKLFCKGVLCLLVFLGMAACSQAQTLHLVVVGDFRGFKEAGLEGIQRDIQHVTSFFRQSVPAQQLNICQVDGNMATPQAVCQAIRNLKVKIEDTIVFYYTGHAANDSENGGQFFLLRDQKGNPATLKRIDIKNQMAEKGCRLIVLLTDCCNVFEENVKIEYSPGTLRGILQEPSPIVQKLFFDCEDVVDLTSSKNGQYSYALKDGSIFTVSMMMTFEELNKEAAKGVDVTWRDWMNKLTVTADVLFKEKFPNGTDEKQTTQIPHAFVYPEIPRFGVSVVSLEDGNVRVEVVQRDYPGEEAGLVPGDIITHINGIEVLNEEEYSRQIDIAEEFADIQFMRKDKKMQAKVKLNGGPRDVVEIQSGPMGTEGSAVLDSSVYLTAEDPQAQEEPVQAQAEEEPVQAQAEEEPVQAQAEEEPVQVQAEEEPVQAQAEEEPVPAQAEEEPASPNEGVVFGISINRNDNQVIAVLSNTPADKSGIKVNDRILWFNNKRIRTGEDFSQAVDASPKRAVLIIRSHRTGQNKRVVVHLNK